jgi:hypothetical protein
MYKKSVGKCNSKQGRLSFGQQELSSVFIQMNTDNLNDIKKCDISILKT